MSPLDRNAAAVVPAWPVVHLALDGSGRATVDGTALDVPDGEDAQVTLLAAATRRALDLGRPVRVRAVDPVGTWTLVAFPDGSVDELADEVIDEAAQDAVDDLDDVPWHLRVHPNGEIVAMDDLGLPADEEPAFRPTPGWVPAPLPVDETPDDETPDQATPDDETPDQATPDDATPADATPDQATPDDETPADVAGTEPAGTDAAALMAPPADQAWHDLVGPLPLSPPPDAHDLVHELRASADLKPEPRSSRRWIPLTLAAALCVLAVGGAVVALREAGPRTSVAATSSASPRTTGTAGMGQAPNVTGAAPAAPLPATRPRPSIALPATLDIAPPPGFTAAPVWGVPVAGETTVAIGADGLVAVVTPDRQLAVVDPGSGAVRWHAATPPQAFGPYLSRVGGQRVLAMLTASRLLYWPLAAGGVPAAAAGAPVEVPLPAGSTVTWAGPSPLVTFGDRSVGVVQGTAVQRVNLPSGARPLAADGTEVLAVAGRNWVRQPAGSPPATPKELPVPEGATRAAPLRVENVGGDFLGAMWAGPNGPVVSVHDARSGAKLAQATFPENVDFSAAPTVRENGTDRTTVGSALFDPAHRNLSILKSPFTPVALAPGHVYATDGSGAVADLQIAGKEFTTRRFTGRNPVVPAGVVPTGGRSLALVVVPSGTGWLLAALPST